MSNLGLIAQPASRSWQLVLETRAGNAQSLSVGQTDVYSISSERLIRLVLEEGKHTTQYVWTPAAPDTSSSLYTHQMSIPNPHSPHFQKSQGSSCQVAVNRSHLHKTKHMALCNVKWDLLAVIKDPCLRVALLVPCGRRKSLCCFIHTS